MAKSTYKNDLYESAHESAKALFNVGAIDKATMHKFDETCLAPVAVFAPRDIQRLRLANKVSQPVFARYLNVRPKLVSEWERGEKKPSGPSLKLLSLVRTRGLDAIM